MRKEKITIKTDCNFKKSYRLRKSSEFSYVKFAGSYKNSHFLKISYVERKLPTHNNNLDQLTGNESNLNPRLGLIVSKKVSKSAVVRNFFKRQLREYFRTRKHQFIKNCDLVVIVKPEIKNLPKESWAKNIQDKLTELLIEAKILSLESSNKPEIDS